MNVKSLLAILVIVVASTCLTHRFGAQRVHAQDQAKNTEIERKFLVVGEDWKKLGSGTLYRQGYLSTHKDRSVRIRVAGEKAFLTIKGASVGISRTEFEYEIPVAEADRILTELCERPLIEKTRYRIQVKDASWVVDVFHGDNAGLVLAEVELKDSRQRIELPPWVGVEISADPRYFNANLSKNPYKNWR